MGDCNYCGREGDQHRWYCPTQTPADRPRRFRFRTGLKLYGCYFPVADYSITAHADGRIGDGKGKPSDADVEWLD